MNILVSWTLNQSMFTTGFASEFLAARARVRIVANGGVLVDPLLPFRNSSL
jgi:hypothetical protein